MLAVPAEVRTWDPPGPPLYTAAVSRTVQSTDLFGPYGDPRVTQHSIAEYQQAVPALGGKYWGERLPEYGGIGGYPFLGQQRVRDLYVSRSHRHFGTGVTKPATYDQPYQLTDLSKSGCRINDERLSAPMKTNFDSVPRQRGPWPGNHPYYSHRSMFEVFPDVRPTQESESLSDGRSSLSTNVTNSYDDALRRLHHKLYHTSLYQDSYRGHFHETKSAPTQPTAELGWPFWKPADESGMPLRKEGGGLLGGNRAYMEGNSEGCDQDGGREEELASENMGEKGDDEDEEKKDEEEGDDNEGEGEKGDDEAESEEIASQSDASEPRSILVTESIKSCGSIRPRLKSAKSQSTQGTKRSVSFNDTPQVQILESRDSRRDSDDANSSVVSSAIPGTGPCWPPSTALIIENIRGSQLLERRDIAQQVGRPPVLTPSSRADPLKQLLSSSKIGEHVMLTPHPPPGGRPSRLPSVPLPSSLTAGSTALAKLQAGGSAKGSRSYPGDAVHLRSGNEVFLHPLEGAQLYGRQQNQPFTVPTSYRIPPMKGSSTFGSLPGLRGSPDPVRKLQDELARRIMMRKGAGATPLVLPPAPLSECLNYPSGSKTPHRLGLRFKTEAHKRYHIVYPEQTPDLRSANHSGRKCFFDGDHSSVFRG